MKKIFSIVMLVVCVVFACMFVTACDNISKEEYEKLNNEYNELLEEKQELEKVSDWIKLYNSIKKGKSFNEIRAMFDFEYSSYSGGSYKSSDDGETHVMRAYVWTNRYVFDVGHIGKNQIVVVFLDDVSICKLYGDQPIVLDCGTVRFYTPTDVSQDS